MLKDKHHNQWTTLHQVSLFICKSLRLSQLCTYSLPSSGMAPEHWVLAAMSNSSLDMPILKMRPPSCSETSHSDAAPHPIRTGDLVLSSHLIIFFHFSPLFSPFFPSLLSLLSFPFHILPSFPSVLSSSFHFPFYLPFSERRKTISSCYKPVTDSTNRITTQC